MQTHAAIMSVNEENIWNGGPEPSNLAEGTKSLGELCLKRFKEQGDVVKMVCSSTFLVIPTMITDNIPQSRLMV